MTDGVGTEAVRFRYLQPAEGNLLTEAIRAAYGDTYDVRWVDPAEVSARLEAGTYVSCVAESADEYVRSRQAGSTKKSG